MPDDGLWSGSAERFAENTAGLGEAGATWVVMVPAGPSDRVPLLAETLVSGRP